MAVESFSDLEKRFADFCRTGEFEDLPGISSKQRVGVYRDLVFGGVSDALQAAYPIAASVLPECDWNGLLERFFASFPCSSPHLWQMPRDLVTYVEQSQDLLEVYPFLLDLLQFEWIEIEIYMQKDIATPKAVEMVESWRESKLGLVLNPHHKLFLVRYPVHRTNDLKLLEEQVGVHFLVCFRNPRTLGAQYTEVSPFFARCIELMSLSQFSFDELLEQSSTDLNIEPTDSLAASIKEFVESSVESGLILGLRAGVEN